jgi:hypothetical protein
MAAGDMVIVSVNIKVTKPSLVWHMTLGVLAAGLLLTCHTSRSLSGSRSTNGLQVTTTNTSPSTPVDSF